MNSAVRESRVVSSVPLWSARRLRFRLIRWLARGDVVLLNALVVWGEGSMLAAHSLDAGALVCGNQFVSAPASVVPGTLVVDRV